MMAIATTAGDSLTVAASSTTHVYDLVSIESIAFSDASPEEYLVVESVGGTRQTYALGDIDFITFSDGTAVVPQLRSTGHGAATLRLSLAPGRTLLAQLETENAEPFTLTIRTLNGRTVVGTIHGSATAGAPVGVVLPEGTGLYVAEAVVDGKIVASRAFVAIRRVR
jgi:hypothetical protein